MEGKRIRCADWMEIPALVRCSENLYAVCTRSASLLHTGAWTVGLRMPWPGGMEAKMRREVSVTERIQNFAQRP